MTDINQARAAYSDNIDLTDGSVAMSEQDFWCRLTDLAIAALHHTATPKMQALAVRLAELDHEFNGCSI